MALIKSTVTHMKHSFRGLLMLRTQPRKGSELQDKQNWPKLKSIEKETKEEKINKTHHPKTVAQLQKVCNTWVMDIPTELWKEQKKIFETMTKNFPPINLRPKTTDPGSSQNIHQDKW